MIKWPNISPVRSLVMILGILSFLIPTVIADGTPPGDSGIGIMTLGGPRATQVSISAPSTISDWVLSPAGSGINTYPNERFLTVGANGDWEVTVYDSSSTTNGQMTDYVGGNYDPSNKFRSPLSVSVASGSAGGIVDTGYSVSLSDTASSLAKGSTTGYPTNTAQIPVTFTQPVSWNDKVSPTGHSYRIVITFAITPYPPTET